MTSIAFWMKRTVKYAIFSLAMSLFFIMTLRAVASDVSTVDASAIQRTRNCIENGFICQSPVFLCENVAELSVDYSHLSSDTKFYGKRTIDRHESVIRVLVASFVIQKIYFLSVPDPTDYYIFGLRKIIV